MRDGFKLGLRGKTTVALASLLFLALAVTSLTSYWQSQTVAEQKVMELEQSKFSVFKHEIEVELTAHHNNLLSLHDLPTIKAIVRAMAHNSIDPVSGDTLDELNSSLTTVFHAFLHNHSQYFQIRLIDTSGNERVKLESGRDNEIVIVDGSQLQNKSDSDYVRETLKLQEGKTYYSNVSLNREYGIIQVPHVPVLRIATPIFDTDNRVAALIVINLSTERLFSSIKSTNGGVQRHIVDEKGYYIKHDDNSKTFGLDRGIDYNFKDIEPELAEIATSQDHLIRRDDQDRELDGFQKIYFSPLDKSRYWLLTLHVPEKVVFSETASALRSILFVSFAIGLFVLLLIVWFVSRKILTPVINLAMATKQLQGGDLSVRLDAASVNDEFHTLYEAINAFAENQQKATSLLESEVATQTKRLSAVIDNVVDGIITIGERGEIESFNPAARKIFGYSDAEVIGQNVKMLMPEPYHSEHDGYLDHHITTGEKKVIGIGREVIGRRKDGSTFPMELAVSEVTIDNVRHFVGITSDITERKAFERQLVDEKKRLSAVIDNVVDGIITISERGMIESFNPAARRIFGYIDDEVIGQNVKMLMPEPYHSEHDGYLDHHITTGEKKVIGIGREVIGRRKNGTTFPMELAVSEVVIDNIRHFVGITRDITERKQVEQMQKEFVSTVSHELRTPLTSIRGSLGLIIGGVTGEIPEKAMALLTIANNNSERLIHLINDILDMEKVTAGKMQFDYTVVNLVTVVQHALESNRGYGDQLSVHFKFTGEADNEVMVRVDEKRMAQVMSNLLSNAAKYSPKDDSVEISVIASEKTVRISVHDNGKGIPDEFKSRIFSKFAQADSSDTRQKGGTGLGLNITKAIVEQQGGGIGFESGEGIGTTFYVDLPIWSEKKPEQKEALKEPDPDKLLVLIVEDDHDVSKLLSLMLDKEGYQFHQAFDYQSALQHIEKHEYDAITLDLMIPGGSGLSLLRQLRANKATSHLPVIVISAKASEGKLEVEGDSLEVMDWIEKPVDEKRLLESLRSGFTHSMTTGVRILHVEDDSDVAQIIDSLTGAEYQITHATTLAQAKQMVSSETFDLVLLDIGLPDGSGLDLLPILHTHERQTPVIIFSAMDVSEEIIAQVDSILIKFKTDNNRLMQQIKSAISKKSKTRKGE